MMPLTKLMTLWITPDSKDSPIQSIDNIDLKEKNGWYYIRTEVERFQADNKVPDLSDPNFKKLVPIYKDSNGNTVTFSRNRSNIAIEIKIFDLNHLGKLIYHNIFNEPPFKCFDGNKIGFRNWNYDSALYKKICIKTL